MYGSPGVPILGLFIPKIDRLLLKSVVGRSWLHQELLISSKKTLAALQALAKEEEHLRSESLEMSGTGGQFIQTDSESGSTGWSFFFFLVSL